MTANKVSERNRILNELQNLTFSQKKIEEQQLMRQLGRLPEWQKSQMVGITLSQSFEINTSPIIRLALQQNKRVCVPRTLPHRQMQFFEFNKKLHFKKSKFGVNEPIDGIAVNKDDIDLMIVPGVCFTSQKQRLGFGGGYYDRYLVNFKGIKLTLALNEMFQLTATWPVEPHDILLDIVVTREEVYR
ncbi:5-formyltetrahydrofolate cyclo-ligase [Paucilactobacillus sp. N302-9]